MAINNPIINQTIANNQSGYESFLNEVMSWMTDNTNMEAALKKADPNISETALQENKFSMRDFISTDPNDALGDSVAVLFSGLEKIGEQGLDQSAALARGVWKAGFGVAGSIPSTVLDLAQGTDQR